jgi:osmotically-inducible protein OsmY
VQLTPTLARLEKIAHWRHFFIALAMLVGLVGLAGCAQIIHVTTSEPIQVNPKKRTLGTKIDDSNLETITRVNLKKASPDFDEANVNIDCFNGVLLLTGQVPTENLRQLAGSTAAQINTVRQVHNELEVIPNKDFKAGSYDTWLATKIKTKLFANSDIESRRIHFITENRSVFLMGLVSRHEAAKITRVAANTKGVTQVVKVFEYID